MSSSGGSESEAERVGGAGRLSTSFAHSFTYQLLARFGSFAINFYLLRAVSTEVLGLANVRLTLLHTTLLFLVREPFRRACLSAGDADDIQCPRRRTALVNLLWCCVPLSLSLGALLTSVWLLLLSRPDDDRLSSVYATAVCYYLLAALVEVLAEPLWIFAQHFYLVKFVALAQGMHVFSQRVIVAALVALWPDNASSHLLAFAYAQLAASVIYTAMFYVRLCRYFVVVRREQRDDTAVTSLSQLMPTFAAGRFVVDRERAAVAYAFLKHSAVKQMLTDGAAYVMTFLHVVTFSQQGVYDAVERIGSVVARCVLAPLEESAHVYFAKTIQRGRAAREQHQRRLATAVAVLYGLLRCTSILGLTAVTFASSYAYLALRLYGGAALATAQACAVLRCYSAYVLLMSLNGVSECFATSTMSRPQVAQHQRWLVALALVHIAAHVALAAAIGPVGFVIANAVNMLLRVVYNLRHTTRYLRPCIDAADSDPQWQLGGSAVSQLIPNVYTVCSLLFALIFTTLSNLIFCCDGAFMTAAHVLVGAVFFGATLGVLFTTDFELVVFAEKFVWHSKRE